MKKKSATNNPKKRILFVEGDKEVDLSFMKMLNLNSYYIQSFKKAADIVVDQMPKENFGKNDDLLFSVAYLYRHSIELQLKYIIHLGVMMKLLKKLPDSMDGHSLYPLWNQAFKVMTNKDGWDEKDIRPLEPLIQDLHNADPTGQEFRYSTKKQMKSKTRSPSLESIPDHVSLVELQKAIQKVYGKLDEVIFGLEAWWDAGSDAP